jgi:hypothetical protein
MRPPPGCFCFSRFFFCLSKLLALFFYPLFIPFDFLCSIFSSLFPTGWCYEFILCRVMPKKGDDEDEDAGELQLQT